MWFLLVVLLVLVRYSSKVTILAKLSTALVVGVDLPQRADLLVSEIVDSAVVGEDMMPT